MRRGAQEPRIRVEPNRAYSDGEDAADLASTYGITPDPWQRLILDAWLGRDENDKFTATSCGLSVPRQNGKNGLIEIRELYGMCCCGEKFLHTAHEVKTARKAFARLASWFENDKQYPELAGMVVSIRQTNGQESITLNNGGSIEFSARSRGAARGFTVDTVVFDEAQELTDEQVEAILSTMAAAPSGNRQFIYTGTPPSPGSPGTVFGRTRKNALAGSDKRLAWHEWSVDSIGDVSDRQRWYDTNPALGIRLDEDFTESEMNTMRPDGFARERLGWWASETANACFNSDEWGALSAVFTDEEIAAQNKWRLAIGVKFSSDGLTASIAVAIWERGETPHVEVIESDSTAFGISWVVNRVEKMWRRASLIVVDGKSNAQTFINELVDAGVSKKAVMLSGPSHVIAASSMLINAVGSGEITHNNQPVLNDAVVYAQKRKIGSDGGYGFKSANEVDVTPLEAVALALWAVKTSKRNPNREMRIG